MTRKERCRDLVGRACELAHEIQTRGGSTYAAGTRWRIHSTHRGRYSIHGIDAAGRSEIGTNGTYARVIHQVMRFQLILEPT